MSVNMGTAETPGGDDVILSGTVNLRRLRSLNVTCLWRQVRGNNWRIQASCFYDAIDIMQFDCLQGVQERVIVLLVISSGFMTSVQRIKLKSHPVKKELGFRWQGRGVSCLYTPQYLCVRCVTYRWSFVRHILSVHICLVIAFIWFVVFRFVCHILHYRSQGWMFGGWLWSLVP